MSTADELRDRVHGLTAAPPPPSQRKFDETKVVRDTDPGEEGQFAPKGGSKAPARRPRPKGLAGDKLAARTKQVRAKRLAAEAEKAAKERERKRKADEAAGKKAEREAAKVAREAERVAKKAEREAEKAAKEAEKKAAQEAKNPTPETNFGAWFAQQPKRTQDFLTWLNDQPQETKDYMEWAKNASVEELDPIYATRDAQAEADRADYESTPRPPVDNALLDIAKDKGWVYSVDDAGYFVIYTPWGKILSGSSKRKGQQASGRSEMSTAEELRERVHGAGLTAAMPRTVGGWIEALHPRGKDGRFIEKNGWVSGLFSVDDGRPGKKKKFDRVQVLGFVTNTKDPDDPYVVIQTGGGNLKKRAYGLASEVTQVASPKAQISKSTGKPSTGSLSELLGDSDFGLGDRDHSVLDALARHDIEVRLEHNRLRDQSYELRRLGRGGKTPPQTELLHRLEIFEAQRADLVRAVEASTLLEDGERARMLEILKRYNPRKALGVSASLAATATSAWTADKRKEAASRGWSLLDGSFPVKDGRDVEKAVRALGRAKNEAAAKRHIIKRAKALGVTDRLPEDWLTD